MCILIGMLSMSDVLIFMNMMLIVWLCCDVGVSLVVKCVVMRISVV